MCRAYRWNDPVAVVDDIEADIHRALENHEKAGRKKAAAIFKKEAAWMKVRARELRKELGATVANTK